MYFDYNAAAPLWPQVQAQLASSFGEAANPSSIHAAGRTARKRLEAARDTVASIFGCTPKEVVFTGSGSEAAALAVLGAFHARADRSKMRVVVSAVEHPCVLMAVEELERAGAQIARIVPERSGRVSLESIEQALNAQTALCSLMWVNNETGVIQPVDAVARLCRSRGVVFHTDAVQAVGKCETALRIAPADLLSFSAHKFGGPTGVGALLVRRDLTLSPLTPGHQENGRRGGTQSVALIEALALALELSHHSREAESQRLTLLRDSFEQRLLGALPTLRINGCEGPRVSNTSNIRVEGVEAEALLIALDLDGHCVSTGAACASGSLTPSHVLTAMGLSAQSAASSLRISFGRDSSDATATALADRIVFHVRRALAVG